MPLTVLDNRGKVVDAGAGANTTRSHPFAAEIKEVLQAVRTGHPSPILGGDLARDAIILAHKQTEAVAQEEAGQDLSGPLAGTPGPLATRTAGIAAVDAICIRGPGNRRSPAVSF